MGLRVLAVTDSAVALRVFHQPSCFFLFVGEMWVSWEMRLNEACCHPPGNTGRQPNALLSVRMSTIRRRSLPGEVIVKNTLEVDIR